jgi:4-hydroxybenzoate polyprenyltransferase
VSSLAARVVAYGRMVKLSHSVFALPFALASALLAGGGRIPWRTLLLIVIAMVGARSAAMGFTRLADHAIDARNPRTAGRELPRGVLSRAQVGLFVVLSAAVLVAAAALLNPLCLALSPVALAVVFGYSYTKRFTSLAHLVLGLALAIAPVGAWLAVRGRLDATPLVIGGAVLFWVAGFDTIYSCQDADFDRASALHSLPARLGIARALRLARGFHLLAAALLVSVFWMEPLHALYLAGTAAVAGGLVYEHTLVRADDLSRVNAAFFLVNGWISVGYLAVTAAARWLA